MGLAEYGKLPPKGETKKTRLIAEKKIETKGEKPS